MFKRFVSERDGTIAVMFAFAFILVALFAGGAVDLARYKPVRADRAEGYAPASQIVAGSALRHVRPGDLHVLIANGDCERGGPRPKCVACAPQSRPRFSTAAYTGAAARAPLPL